MLRVGVPRQGPAVDRATALLRAAGVAESTGVAAGSAGLPVKVFRLPERDVAVLARHGGLHLAVVDSLAVDDASTSVPVVLELGDLERELALFVPAGGATLADLQGVRVATPYPHLVRRRLAAEGIVVRRVIAVEPAEHAVALGIAEAVAVIVGRDGVPAGPLGRFSRVASLLDCRLVVIEGATEDDDLEEAKRVLVRRLDAVRLAGTVHLLQFECPTAEVDTAVAALASTHTPDVATIPGSLWSRVRLLVPRAAAYDHVETLTGLGCRDVVAIDPVAFGPGRTRELRDVGSARPHRTESVPDPRSSGDGFRSDRVPGRSWDRREEARPQSRDGPR